MIDIDTLSKNNNVYVDQEGVKDGAPWLKCEHRILKTTDRDMILKSSVYFAIAVSQIRSYVVFDQHCILYGNTVHLDHAW